MAQDKVETTLKNKKVVTKEEQVHIDARDARVLDVKNAIAAAKVLRDQREVDGVVETAGAKMDREAKEAKDLEEAEVLNVIEPFGVQDNSKLEVMIIADKLSEVIAYINKHSTGRDY